MKSKFPLIIILAGIIIMGIGGWQFLDVKMETEASIKKAKTIIAEHKTAPQEKGNEEDKENEKGKGEKSKTKNKPP